MINVITEVHVSGIFKAIKLIRQRKKHLDSCTCAEIFPKNTGHRHFLVSMIVNTTVYLSGSMVALRSTILGTSFWCLFFSQPTHLGISKTDSGNI